MARRMGTRRIHARLRLTQCMSNAVPVNVKYYFTSPISRRNQELAHQQIMSVDELVGPPQQTSTFASSKSRYLTDKLKECLTRKQDMQR